MSARLTANQLDILLRLIGNPVGPDIRGHIDTLESEITGLRARTQDMASAVARADAAEGRAKRLEAQKDGAYAERNQCVALIARMTEFLGWKAYVTRHPDADVNWENDWRTIVYIELPTGQVTWHFHDSEKHLLAGMSAGPNVWDGHDTAEKYRRVNAALSPNSPPTHRCKVCGALWWQGVIDNGVEKFPSWSLRSPKCGPCCDNVAMGDQIEPLAPAGPGADGVERSTRNELEHTRHLLDMLHGHVADMVRFLDPRSGIPDSWTLRDLIQKERRERDSLQRRLEGCFEEAARVAEPEPEYAYHYEAREALNKAAAAIRALTSQQRGKP